MFTIPRPNKPSPTTDIPITAPPEKATPSALLALSWAAFAVRTLALVATFIPIQPANTEQMAPKINATAVVGCMLSLPGVTIPATTITAARAATNTASVTYSLFRNAIAPS